MFQSIVGDKTYQLIRWLSAPKELSDDNYDAIIINMTNHYNSKKSVIVEIFKFNNCNSKPSQQVQHML